MSSRDFDDEGSEISSYPCLVGSFVEVTGTGSDGVSLGRLVLVALEACRLCQVGMSCERAACLSEESLALACWSSLNML